MWLIDAAEVDGAAVFAVDVPAVFASPLDVREVGLVLPILTFPRPAVYCWQVVFGGAVLYERRIVVAKIGAAVLA